MLDGGFKCTIRKVQSRLTFEDLAICLDGDFWWLGSFCWLQWATAVALRWCTISVLQGADLLELSATFAESRFALLLSCLLGGALVGGGIWLSHLYSWLAPYFGRGPG